MFRLRLRSPSHRPVFRALQEDHRTLQDLRLSRKDLRRRRRHSSPRRRDLRQLHATEVSGAIGYLGREGRLCRSPDHGLAVPGTRSRRLRRCGRRLRVAFTGVCHRSEIPHGCRQGIGEGRHQNREIGVEGIDVRAEERQGVGAIAGVDVAVELGRA